jgi:hypothetical protein
MIVRIMVRQVMMLTEQERMALEAMPRTEMGQEARDQVMMTSKEAIIIPLTVTTEARMTMNPTEARMRMTPTEARMTMNPTEATEARMIHLTAAKAGTTWQKVTKKRAPNKHL